MRSSGGHIWVRCPKSRRGTLTGADGLGGNSTTQQPGGGYRRITSNGFSDNLRLIYGYVGKWSLPLAMRKYPICVGRVVTGSVPYLFVGISRGSADIRGDWITISFYWRPFGKLSLGKLFKEGKIRKLMK